MKSGLILEVVLILRTIIHAYMDLGLNQNSPISKVTVLYRWLIYLAGVYRIGFPQNTLRTLYS